MASKCQVKKRLHRFTRGQLCKLGWHAKNAFHIISHFNIPDAVAHHHQPVQYPCQLRSCGLCCSPLTQKPTSLVHGMEIRTQRRVLCFHRTTFCIKTAHPIFLSLAHLIPTCPHIIFKTKETGAKGEMEMNLQLRRISNTNQACHEGVHSLQRILPSADCQLLLVSTTEFRSSPH